MLLSLLPTSQGIKPAFINFFLILFQAAAKKPDWRKKRMEMINALRAAKEAQRHVAAGGKLSDLPAAPPLDTSDYIQCPHCNRKFNEGAAERHIPKCANIKSNKR